jgi:surface antigen
MVERVTTMRFGSEARPHHATKRDIAMPVPTRKAEALLLLMTLCACTAPPTQEQAGLVIGGVLGGALGSQVGGGQGRTAATVVGTLICSSVGAVGRSRDDTDRLKVARTLETARTGVPSQWRNPDTGNQYTVVPTRTYDTAGTPCREYTVDGMNGGRHQNIVGTACRQADGSWRTR